LGLVLISLALGSLVAACFSGATDTLISMDNSYALADAPAGNHHSLARMTYR
jgi:hypothetical protein